MKEMAFWKKRIESCLDILSADIRMTLPRVPVFRSMAASFCESPPDEMRSMDLRFVWVISFAFWVRKSILEPNIVMGNSNRSNSAKKSNRKKLQGNDEFEY